MDTMRILGATVVLTCTSVAPCHATDYLTIEEAQKLTFPPGSHFTVAHVIFTDEHKAKIEAQSGVPVTARAQKIWKVFGGNDQLLGWFVVDYVIGKHLLIDYAVAINADRSVKEVEILSYRESYGGEIRSEHWLKQFDGKTSHSRITLNDDITNIGGATLSSRHVTEGVKRILATIDATQ